MIIQTYSLLCNLHYFQQIMYVLLSLSRKSTSLPGQHISTTLSGLRQPATVAGTTETDSGDYEEIPFEDANPENSGLTEYRTDDLPHPTQGNILEKSTQHSSSSLNFTFQCH